VYALHTFDFEQMFTLYIRLTVLKRRVKQSAHIEILIWTNKILIWTICFLGKRTQRIYSELL